MSHEDELARALDKIWEKGNERNWILGRLGVENGANEDIDVAGRPGYVVVSLGAAGNLGHAIARDRVGAARSNFQQIRMRRENGELVIREASAYAGGAGGGSDTLDGLSDVVLSGVADGQVLTYSSEIGQWRNEAGGAGTGMVAHAHEGSYHTGELNWGTVNKTGSSLSHIVARDHSQLNSIAPDQHHPHVHPLVGTDALGVAQHTASGLTAGHTLRATSATTFAWAQLQHDDLGGITANQHHMRVHDIITGDLLGGVHSIVGAPFDLVGATAANALGLHTPTHTPGATAKILKTDALGSLMLDTTLFVADAPNNWIGVNRTPNGAALDVTSFALADITLRVKQKQNQTNRILRIEDWAGQELIVMDQVGNLQSGNPGYVSGLRGWQISHTGNAEFNDIWARGELHATVFVKDEVHATGGTFIVSTAGKLYADAIINSAVTDNTELEVDSSAAAFPGPELLPLTIEETSAGFTGTTLFTQGIGNSIDLEDPPSGPASYFQPGEILRVKTEIDQKNVNQSLRMSDLWLEVMSVTQKSGYSTYSVMKRSGTDSTIPKGTAIVSYKQRGEGLILMTSDLQYAPYIDVFTTGNSPWLGTVGEIVPRIRMGQLMGVGLPGISGVSQFGIVMGSDLSDANSGYIVASDRQFSLYKVPIRVNNGVADTGLWEPNGNISIGRNIGDVATTGFRVITSNPSNPTQEGMVIIGNVSTGNFLRWNQETGILTVSGNLLVEIPDTDVTKTYVDDQDDWFDGLAAGYASTQGGLAKDHSDFRRVIKVTGSWDSPAANIIRWGATVGVAIHFGKGLPRTVTSGQTTTLSTRNYLFVDLAVTSGNLTLIQSTTATINNPNYVLVAICDPGTPSASVTVVAGSTYISGGNIFTGSILAGNIATDAIRANHILAGEVTAEKISVTSLSTIDTNTGSLTVTGNLTVGSAGKIFSSGKTTYASTTAGFFLGYDSGYKFNIGDGSYYLRWTGTDIELSTKKPLIIKAPDVNAQVIKFVNFNTTDEEYLYFRYINSESQLEWQGVLDVNYLNIQDGTFAIFSGGNADNKAVMYFRFGVGNTWLNMNGTNNVLSYTHTFGAPSFQFTAFQAPASNAIGLPGQMVSNGSFLYVCVASGDWRRVALIDNY